MTEKNIKQQLSSYLLEHGANLVGATSPALPSRYTERFATWLNAGHHADMDYLPRRLENNVTPESLLPGTRTVIALAFNYYFEPDRSVTVPSGKISRYACFRDYHKAIGGVLKKATRYIEEELDGKARSFVDTSPLLERAYAEQAGLGYIGRSGMLITREYGTWVFLALILTTLELPFDEPVTYNFCGSCTRCIDACPTKALVGDGTLVSQKCISYQTIENRGEIPASIHNGMGTHLFGCDICQTVCPHNSRQNDRDRLDDFQDLRFPTASFPLDTELNDNDSFLEHFAGTPVTRTKLSGLNRNLDIVRQNLK